LDTWKKQFPVPSYILHCFPDELDHIIWIPIYDRIVVPFLRRITGKESGFTILRRMGIGIFLSVITMIVSDLVDER